MDIDNDEVIHQENSTSTASVEVNQIEENNEQTEHQTKPKRKSKRIPLIVLTVIAVVIIGAGVGVWVWHEDPSFCNAICHDPMDPYVEGYYSGDAKLMVTAHAEAGEDCLSCHWQGLMANGKGRVGCFRAWADIWRGGNH